MWIVKKVGWRARFITRVQLLGTAREIQVGYQGEVGYQGDPGAKTSGSWTSQLEAIVKTTKRELGYSVDRREAVPFFDKGFVIV